MALNPRPHRLGTPRAPLHPHTHPHQLIAPGNIMLNSYNNQPSHIGVDYGKARPSWRDFSWSLALSVSSGGVITWTVPRG